MSESECRSESQRVRARGGRPEVAINIGAIAGSRFLRQLVMVVVMAIAARMLEKEVLGVWALVYILIQFGVLLSDSGISTFVVRQKELDARTYSTAFYLALGFSVLVSLMTAIIAVPIVTWLGYREFVWEFAASAAAIVPLTTNGLLQSKLRRDCRFKMILGSDACASLLLLFAAIVMLRSGCGLWSFIVPTIVASSASVMVCVFATGVPTFCIDRSRIKEILDYSLGLVGFSSVNHWARNADHVLIGQVLGAAPLGVYSFAYRIMMLPLSQINATAHMVALPYLARIQDDPKKLRESMKQIITAIGMITTLPMIWIWLERDYLVALVLGDRWSGVADLLAVLAPLAILQSLVNPIGLCFQVSGRTKQLFAVGIIHTIAMLLSFVIGVCMGTLEWVVVCYALANIVMIPISVGTGLRTIGGRMGDWIVWCLPFFAVLPVCWTAHRWMPRVELPWMQAMMTVLATGILVLPVFFLIFRATFRSRASSHDHVGDKSLTPSFQKLWGRLQHYGSPNRTARSRVPSSTNSSEW